MCKCRPCNVQIMILPCQKFLSSVEWAFRQVTIWYLGMRYTLGLGDLQPDTEQLHTVNLGEILREGSPWGALETRPPK